MENINALDVIGLFKGLLNNPYMHVMVLVVLLDFVTGFSRSLVQGVTNSSIGTKGFCKHSMIIVTMLSGYPYMSLLGYGFAAKTIAVFFIINYLISIIENLDGVGIAFPKTISERLYKLRDMQDHVDKERKNKQ